jgi:hypothetical protein
MTTERDEVHVDVRFDRQSTDGPAEEQQPSLDSIIGRLRYGGERMDMLEERLGRIEKSMDHNTDMTRDVHELLVAVRSGLVTLAKVGRGLAAIGRWLHRFFKWALPIAAGIAFIWHQFHNGDGTPPPPTPALTELPPELPPGIER